MRWMNGVSTVTKTDKDMGYSMSLNVIKACEDIAQARVRVQRAWVANPVLDAETDDILYQIDIDLERILDKLRALVK
jgi:hypothetical protein